MLHSTWQVELAETAIEIKTWKHLHTLPLGQACGVEVAGRSFFFLSLLLVLPSFDLTGEDDNRSLANSDVCLLFTRIDLEQAEDIAQAPLQDFGERGLPRCGLSAGDRPWALESTTQRLPSRDCTPATANSLVGNGGAFQLCCPHMLCIHNTRMEMHRDIRTTNVLDSEAKCPDQL